MGVKIFKGGRLKASTLKIIVITILAMLSMFFICGCNETNNSYTDSNGFKIYTNGAEKILVGYYGNSSEITIPNGVTSIENSVFKDCDTLTSLTIPNSVTSIADSAFSGCLIENVTMPTSAISYIPRTNKLKTVVITGGTTIYGYAFYGCSSLTSVTIGNSVTSIGSYAFSGCPIENVTMPTSAISYIPHSKLKTVVITGGTSIRDEAFEDCKSLTSVTIGNSVTSIGYSAFRDCTSLTSVTIGNGVKNMVSSAFSGCPIENVTMPTSAISYIPQSKLKTVVITGGTSIEREAFQNCESLTSIEIPNSVTSIGYRAFYSCNSLTSVTIGNGLIVIEDDAFQYCHSLTSITIPNSVERIGDSAFRYCSSLTSIEIPNRVRSMGGSVFEYCTNLTIYCEVSSKPSSGWSSSWNYSNCPVVWDYKNK